MSVKVPKMIRKGVGVANDTDPTKAAILTVDDDAITNTATVLVAKQTDDRTLILPDEDGTIVTNKTTDELVKTTGVVIADEIATFDGTSGKLIRGGTSIKVHPSDIHKSTTGATPLKIRTVSSEGAPQSSGIEIKTGNAGSQGQSGDIDLSTGNSSYSTDTGNITLTTGTSSSGTRGKITMAARVVELDGPAATPTTDNSIATKKYVDDNAGGGGSGDVEGPASSRNNSATVFDGTDGKKIKQVQNLQITESGGATQIVTPDISDESNDLFIGTADASSDVGQIWIMPGTTDTEDDRKGVTIYAGWAELGGNAEFPTSSNSIATKRYVDDAASWITMRYGLYTPVDGPVLVTGIQNDDPFDDSPYNTKIEYVLNLESQSSDQKILVEESGNFRNLIYGQQWGSNVNQVMIAPDGDLIFAGGGLFLYPSSATGRLTKCSPDSQVDQNYLYKAASRISTFSGTIDKLYKTDDYLYVGSNVNSGQALGRYDWTGQFDYQFWENTQVSQTTTITAIRDIKQIGDKIFVVGEFIDWGGITDYNHLVVFNLDGTIDTTTTTSISGSGKFQSTSHTVGLRTIAEDNNGKIWIGGRFDTYGSAANRNGFIRLNSDYTIDNTYCSTHLDNKIGPGNIVYKIAVDSSNNVFFTSNVDANTPILKFSNNAGYDTSFNSTIYNDTYLWNSQIQHMLITKDDKILLGGNFNIYEASLVLLDTDGKQNSDFMTNVGLNDYEFQVSDMKFAEDESVLYCTINGNIGEDGLGRIVKIQMDKNVYSLHGTLYITTDKSGKVQLKDVRHSGNGFVGNFRIDGDSLMFNPRFPSDPLVGTIKTRLTKNIG